VKLKVLSQIREIAQGAWDALVGPDDPHARWAWLDAFEEAGCVDPTTGWQACHLTVWRGSHLIGAAPAYLRSDSDGDFSRDWGWASAAARGGVAYYPKLSLTIPFTPVTGTRFLVAEGEDRDAILDELARGALTLAKELSASCVQVLFPREAEAIRLEAHGFSRRVDFQFHWHNDNYADPDDFLARFSSKKRNQARRERAAPATQGITLRTLRGEELAHDRANIGRLAFNLHRSTIDKLMWGRRWLNQAFYDLVFERMPEPLELVVAEREGKVIAGAFNLATPTRLLGRYWGCFEDHPFLHFNVCLYHSLDDCIARGLQSFEGGAGGEHKIARGFLPTFTFSSHKFLDPRLERPLSDYIKREADEREAALVRFNAESPILRKR